MDQETKSFRGDQSIAPSGGLSHSSDSLEGRDAGDGVEVLRASDPPSPSGLDPSGYPPDAANASANRLDPSLDPTARLFQEIKGWVPDLFFAALIALFIVFFVVHPVRVEGVSMLPQLVDQERIFVNRFIYHLTEIHRGDIVVFFFPKDTNKSFIKRVVGLPGDIVEIKSGLIYINGKPLGEPYIDPKFMDYDSHAPVKVREGCYYVMGDHRNQSNDSRHWGLVPRENIYGKAMFRYWPVSRLGTLD